MSILAAAFIGFWLLMMLWASIRWYPSIVDRVGHFLYQMFLVAVFLVSYLLRAP